MQAIKKVIGAELKYFEEYFDRTFKSENNLLLDRILTYLASRKGKQMRPMFVLLCARLGGDINEQSYRAALFVEMLHTSSLVHDDLIDDSMERRGAHSINAIWKNRAAVFTGDNLFTNSVLLLLKNKDYKILQIFSDSIGKVIEGELLQMDKSRKLNLDENIYFDIIRGKTATLLASACATGAASTFSDQTLIDKLYLFGEKIGIAFQIKDDLMDFGDVAIGKPRGNDIKEGKATLPLIYTFNNCEPSLRKKLMYIFKHRNKEDESVNYLIKEVVQNGGIEYAAKKMQWYSNEALQLLHEFPESDTRDALEELVNYTTGRVH
jgi:octaprenyl-diphosphate synthase